MKTAILQFLVLFLTVSLGHSLECMHCVTYGSWADCVSHGYKIQCPEGFTNCAKLQKGQEFPAFTAACASPQQCKEICEGDKDCSVECCSEDMCNNGTAPSTPQPEGSSEAKPLSCYLCHSTSDLDDCAEHQAEKACPARDYRCGVLSYRGKGKSVFAKGCVEETKCQAGCKEAVEEGAECELNCCNTDNCNL